MNGHLCGKTFIEVTKRVQYNAETPGLSRQEWRQGRHVTKSSAGACKSWRALSQPAWFATRFARLSVPAWSLLVCRQAVPGRCWSTGWRSTRFAVGQSPS